LENQFTVYIKAGCHLCEEMLSALEAQNKKLGLDFNTVTIEDSKILLEQYGHKVPVLVHGDTEICHYFLDIEALTDAINRMA